MYLIGLWDLDGSAGIAEWVGLIMWFVLMVAEEIVQVYLLPGVLGEAQNMKAGAKNSEGDGASAKSGTNTEVDIDYSEYSEEEVLDGPRAFETDSEAGEDDDGEFFKWGEEE